MKTINQQNYKSQRALFLKIGFILLLLLLLMIPNLLIQNLILERQSLDSEVKQTISSHWGPSQQIIGPILSIPYTKEVEFDDTKKLSHHTLRIVPENLEMDVDLNTEERKKGIYKAILYNGNHQLSGSFNLPSPTDFGDFVKEIHWDRAVVDIGFSSAASLDDIVQFYWNNDTYKMESGLSNSSLFYSGIHTKVTIDSLKEVYQFSSEIGINGSRSIQYLPIAGNTKVRMNSSWDSPGFFGLPSPQHREISNDGFTAEWSATEYNRPFKNMWKDNEVQLYQEKSLFGVELIQTVGHYQKNMRSAKYALLILSLSFLVFFFFEILKGSKIHPIQYIFIGLTLSVFYILLLSFSEHIGFNSAYILAATATIGLISWYSRYLLKQGNKVVILSAVLVILYGYIFTILQMEDLALLVGSIGLFATLAITMYLSRNTDWYTMGSGSTTSNSADDLVVPS
ncbi:MAG: cell envelope integrity protein CreD [Bacteroidota bacterium]